VPDLGRWDSHKGWTRSRGSCHSRRLFLLQNVVDTTRFAPTARSEREEFVLLAAGRLTDQKRLDRFLDLVARVRREVGPQVRGLVVGTGPLEAELKAKASSLELKEAVHFIGAVEDMAPVFDRADVFVLTSDWEGTPNVLLEAMACGLPCVATRVGGVADMGAAPGVELFDPDDLPGMEARLTQLASTARQREELGRGNRDHVLETYSTDVLRERLRALYAAVHSEGH
jgi:glycosyltransferase involved in cell wall biosynthesis